MEIQKLKDICLTEITDGTHQTPTYSEYGYIFLSSKNVTTQKIDWDNVMFIPEKLHEELYKRVAPQIDDILLAKNGTTGVAAIVDRDIVFDIYVSLALIRPNTEIVMPRYLLYAINNPVVKGYFDSSLKGIGVPNLHLKNIRETPIKIYDLETQKAIVEKLDKVCELISLRKQQLAKLDELVKARFVEMFGDVFLNPMEWPEKKLESLADIVSGITKGRKTTETDLQEVPYMAVSNVKDGYIDWTTVKTILATRREIEQYRLMPDDILMTEGGDPDKVGRGAIIKMPLKNSIHQNHIFRVRLNEQEILPDFLAEYLQHQKAKRYFLGCAKQTTGIASINMRQIKALPTLVPPLSLQNQFAAFVERVDKQKQTVQQSLEKLELMKKALMQEYFG